MPSQFPAERSTGGINIAQMVQSAVMLLSLAVVVIMFGLFFAWTHHWIGAKPMAPILYPLEDSHPPANSPQRAAHPWLNTGPVYRADIVPDYDTTVRLLPTNEPPNALHHRRNQD